MILLGSRRIRSDGSIEARVVDLPPSTTFGELAELQMIPYARVKVKASQLTREVQ